MELERALELAVISSWGDVVKPGDTSSVHVEYESIAHLPLRLLEVWTVKDHGYGTLVCRYSPAANNSGAPASERSAICFANSYHSQLLTDSLNFIIRNQARFTHPSDGSIHGLVQVDSPSDEDRSDARTWSEAVVTEFADTVWN
jgi:hypothetical protein